MEIKIVREEAEIDELIDECDDAIREGTKFRGMSYEDGIKAGIEWLTDPECERPMQ